MQRSHDEAVGQATEPEQAEALQRNLDAQFAHLRGVQALCAGSRCRHRALCEHFGQRFGREGCGACDVCLGEIDAMPDATTVARKILSGVARTGQRFGVGHVVKVLVGADDENVRRFGHEALSVHGILRELKGPAVTNLVHQLLDHGLLARTEGDRPTVFLTQRGAAVMRGDGAVVLRQPAVGRKPAKVKRAAVEASGWLGVDRDLFDRLRDLRRRLALERGVPPYVVFDDNTLRELSRLRPSTLEAFATVRGVGQRKLADYGETFIAAIAAHCQEHGVAMDVARA